MRADLPSGTVTFLFTDVEGSTKLLDELGAEGYAEALTEHRRVIRKACAAEGGVEVDTQGDAFFFAFPTAPGALAAASAFTAALASGPIQVRVGLHTGTPLLTEEGYVGGDVHRAARIAASGHGGQVLVSSSTAQLVEDGAARPRRAPVQGPLPLPSASTSSEQATSRRSRASTARTCPSPRHPSSAARQSWPRWSGSYGGGRRACSRSPAPAARARHGSPCRPRPRPPSPSPTASTGCRSRRFAIPRSSSPRSRVRSRSRKSRARRSRTTLTAHMSGKSLLCLLDNVEHLLPEAAERIAALRASNGSCLLVTSRERLRIGGEQTWPVPPLAESDGAALFVARARAVDPTFTAELGGRRALHATRRASARDRARRRPHGRLLDRAAARATVAASRPAQGRSRRRSPPADAAGDDRMESPAPLDRRAAALCPPRCLRRRLHVRGGGGDRGADPDTLQSLLDKSLLRKRDSMIGLRYWMLETIREYASERLEDSAEAEELRRRHAAHYLAVAEALPDDAQVEKDWLDRTEIELDNLRASLDNLSALGETQLVLRLAGALWRLWGVRGYHREGMQRLEEALLDDESATAARARALIGACAIAVDVKEYERAFRYVDEALDLYRGGEDAWGIARATFFQGYVAVESGDFARARPPFEESLERFTELDAEHDVQLVLFNLSWACDELGDEQRARDLAEEFLQRARASGNRRNLAFALDLLSHCARDDGRLDEALEAALEGLRIRCDEGDVQHQLDGLSRVASIHARADRMEEAARLLSSSVHLHEEFGMLVPLYQEKRNEETLHILHEQLDEAAFDEAWEQGKKLTLDEAVALALDSVE